MDEMIDDDRHDPVSEHRAALANLADAQAEAAADDIATHEWPVIILEMTFGNVINITVDDESASYINQEILHRGKLYSVTREEAIKIAMEAVGYLAIGSVIKGVVDDNDTYWLIDPEQVNVARVEHAAL